MTASNAALAAAALDVQHGSAPGLSWRAAGVASVVLATTRTVSGATRELRKARLDDDVRDAAALLIDALAAVPLKGATDPQTDEVPV